MVCAIFFHAATSNPAGSPVPHLAQTNLGRLAHWPVRRRSAGANRRDFARERTPVVPFALFRHHTRHNCRDALAGSILALPGTGGASHTHLSLFGFVRNSPLAEKPAFQIRAHRWRDDHDNFPSCSIAGSKRGRRSPVPGYGPCKLL